WPLPAPRPPPTRRAGGPGPPRPPRRPRPCARRTPAPPAPQAGRCRAPGRARRRARRGPPAAAPALDRLAVEVRRVEGDPALLQPGEGLLAGRLQRPVLGPRGPGEAEGGQREAGAPDR